MSFKCFVRSKAIAAGSAFFGVGLFMSAAFAQPPILVTSSADDGPGSLRAALATAAETPGPIFVVTDKDIETETTLAYAGREALVLHGNGQTVKISANADILALTEGADLAVTNLKFAGPGGFSITERDNETGSGGKGIFIDVRSGQPGLVRLVLEDVTVSDVAYHGVHISDCDLADACGGGSGGGGDGAPASIAVQLTNVEIRDVGNGVFDADGIRVDERGDGNIFYSAFGSTFRDVGADGVELDEGDAGDVVATVIDNRFLDNGGYCDLNVLEPALPAEPLGEFADGEKAEADIPGQVTGTADDRCFEREVLIYDTGFVESYEISIDLDDGIDIDEAGEGDLRLVMTGSEIRGNLDEGVDLDEEDDGSAFLSVVRTTANKNTDDGIRLSESDAGDVTGLVYAVSASDNGGYGIRFDQSGDGDISVDVYETKTSDNDDNGLRVGQTGSGTGMLAVTNSNLKDGIDARNVDVTEN